MSGWMRYSDRLAHLVHDDAKPITEQRRDEDRPRRVGTRWRTHCGRELLLWFEDGRNPSAWWLPPEELVAENPRGWCLRCAYWAARDALIVPGWSFDDFVRVVYANRWRIDR